MSALEDFHAVVPAGGAGTRLWPLSRQGAPKFLHDLTGGGRSLLQATYDRLAPLAGSVLVVTGGPHAASVARQLPAVPVDDVLVEPSPRDSAAAIGLAAAVLLTRDPQAIMGSFAADHVVRDVAAFGAAVREAVAVARTGLLVTVGIEPTHPATGFGYVRTGRALAVPGAPSARQVEEFVEKPDAAGAAAYLADGRYRWNAGMFLARAATVMDLLAGYRPALAAGLTEIAAAWHLPQRQDVLERVWPTLPAVAFDYAVAEPAAAAGRVAVVPADLGWDDVGDFASLAAVLPAAGPSGVQVLGDAAVLAEHSTGLVVGAGGSSSGAVAGAPGRLVVLVGVEDVVVVDTPDALLVTTRSSAQQVKAVVEALRAAGRTDLL